MNFEEFDKWVYENYPDANRRYDFDWTIEMVYQSWKASAKNERESLLDKLREPDDELALNVLKSEGDGAFSQQDVDEIKSLIRAIAEDLEEE